MIYLVHHTKYVIVVTLIASVLFSTSNVSTAQVSDPTLREKLKTETFTLEECISIALENNLQLAAARKRLDSAGADRIKASLLLPTNPKLGSEIGARESSSERHTDYTIALSQEFEFYGQRRKRISVANKKIERVKFEIADIERNVISKVKTNFYEVLTSLEIVKLQSYVEGIFERIYNATRERYKAGAISALELNSMKIKYGVARQQLLAAKNNYQNSLLSLRLVLGKPGDEALNIEGKLSYEKLQIGMEEIIASAYKVRPDLKAAELEKERASKEISLRKAEIIPNPSLSGFFSREEGTDDIVGGEVSISIPIWDRKQSELKKARTAKDVAGINIKNRYLEIQKEVEAAYRSFMAAKEGIAIYTDEIMPQVDENLKLNEISYKEGKINFIGFLTVQSDLIETRAAYLNALLDYNNAIINLETVSGMKLRLLD
ncbi:MAG: efflux transporter [Candidatus Scalindua rubra]|uniref:Efflux transporter n=1 Tax=Candidatus Scalindua rubra TaxID=1872076 RepID=A0A1E3X8E9_9BACT|nr:MAG: efflux transporter [Candidatus Scalindua rubra]